MQETVNQSLVLMGIGIGGVFVVLIVFFAIMAVVMGVANRKKAG